MSILNRRNFIKGTAAGAASIPLFSIGKPGPSANGKINVAVVGAGGMGGYAFRRAASMENLVALCDVDFDRASRALNKHKDVPRFKDFRVRKRPCGRCRTYGRSNPGPGPRRGLRSPNPAMRGRFRRSGVIHGSGTNPAVANGHRPVEGVGTCRC